MQQVDHDDLLCKYCGKECKNKKSLAQHECRCPQNVNRYTDNIGKNNGMYGKKAWNNGLTKITDNRISKIANSLSLTMKQKSLNGELSNPFKSEYWTKERRAIQSQKKKDFYKLHPEQHPNRKLSSNRNKMTYPEQLVYDYLNNNNINFIAQYKIEDKWYDFYLQDYNVVIEVDGVKWHCTDKAKQNDLYKDQLAYKHNLNIYRITTSKDIIVQLSDILNNFNDKQNIQSIAEVTD